MVIDDFLNYKDAFPLSHTQEADIIDYLDFFLTLSIRCYLCRFFVFNNKRQTTRTDFLKFKLLFSLSTCRLSTTTTIK